MLTSHEINEISRCQRIHVIGTSGSGKSTVARTVSEILGLPRFELDQMYWQPNWKESDLEGFRAKVRPIMAGQRWVFDGNYTAVLPFKWERAELAIWLDLSFLQTFRQLTLRTIRRSLSGREVWPGTGCYESLAKGFLSRDSIILWAIRTHFHYRREYEQLMAATADSPVRVLRFRTRRDVQRFLKQLSQARSQQPSSS